MLIGGPRFLPLVELLLLSSLPPFLPSSLPLFKKQMPHSCHQLSALLTASLARGGLPLCNLSTPGGGLFTQRRLGAPCAALLTSPPTQSFALFSFPLSFLHSYSAVPPPFSSPHSMVHALSQPSPPTSVVLWSTHSGTGAALLCGSPSSGDVNQSWFFYRLSWSEPKGQRGSRHWLKEVVTWS